MYGRVEFRRFNHEPHGDPAFRDIAARCPVGRWMTKTNMDLTELLAKQDGGAFLRAVAEAVLQLIMEFERQAIDPGDRL